MAWDNRLKPAIYTSPSGVSFSFSYEDISSSISKKTTEFNFPDGDGSYIQDLGKNGRKYPFNAIFYGANNDTEAAAFEAALLERGAGRLSHPIYGVKDVVPFGEIATSVNLKSGAGQTIVSVTFFDTIGLVYPLSQIDPRGALDAALVDFNDKLSFDFASNLKLDSVFESLSFKNEFLSVVNDVNSVFGAITEAEKQVNDLFNDVYNSINFGIDILLAKPATLAFQTAILFQTPGLLIQSLEDRVDGYKNVITSLIGGKNKIHLPSKNSNVGANSFFNNELGAVTSISGYIKSVSNWKFDTKTEALIVADDILSLFEDITNWRDSNFASLGIIDQGGEFQALQNLVSLAAGFLVDLSFSLKTERVIILDRSRTIIDLTAELYGEVDSKIDFLISSNNFSGNEFIEIPKGRKIRYFV